MEYYSIYQDGQLDATKKIQNKICQIILEGEPTEIGRKVTIDRIKDALKYNQWIEMEDN